MEMHGDASLFEIIRHALVVTAFVFAMMTCIDYLNVMTRGGLESFLRRGRKRQYVGSSFLGATPGCVGAFAVTSLYAHQLLSFGAIVACMLATSGDEAFVMLALFPAKALLIFTILFVLGIFWGWLSDRVAAYFRFTPCEGCSLLAVHEEHIQGIHPARIPVHLAHPSPARLCTFIIIAVFVYMVLAGSHGNGEEHWITVTLLGLLGIVAFITVTVPEHYLKVHIWQHLVKEHLWKIFLWVFGAMLAVHLLSERLELENFVSGHTAWVLPVAVLVGIIPESGPHLVFVIMFSRGLVPFSVLLASCISQDGHGMLPLLSVSVKDFFMVKIFKIAAALAVGYLAYWAGM
jgi:hypothetical protein